MLKLSGWPRLTWGRGARAGGGGRSSPPFSRRPSSSVGGAQGASPPRGGGATTSGTRRVAGPTLVAPRPAPGEGGRRSSARRAAGGQSPRPAARRARSGATRSRDAQAGVPSAGWPRAQLAFKDSMVHGILQFTPSIAFRYVLHRCESRDIRCRESCDSCVVSFLRVGARRPGGAAARAEGRDVLGASRAGCGVMSSRPLHARAAEAAPPVGGAGGRRGTPAGGREGRRARARPPTLTPPRPRPALPRVLGSSACLRRVSTMILPQVHLRKPCYDFSFL
ncbi:hypothetical protein IHE45_20G012600 [Dioscorea alata]|uniref:Uncharacterized protein n=1 Tax=Dioscorea alata TaxID=55571 RepID=A0ACB7TQ77_DIOAL|nr:hypothetical protein IHE45_20G012600 [Dioscorea alata]